MGDILTGTPPELTYGHPVVREAWTVVWGIASGALLVILGWIGLSLIMQHHLGQSNTGWREAIPRLVLGLVAAATSYWWCALVIDVAHNVSKYVAAALNVTPGDMLRAPLETFLRTVEAGSVGMALLLALLFVIFGFFVLYVLVQMVLRLALIDILLALAPIALGLWILPHTAGWGRHWLRLFLTTVFQQAVQLIALAMGFGFLSAVCGDTGLRAGPGPGVEAAALDCLRLHGHPRALDAGQRRHLRLLGEHPLLRPFAAGYHPALGEERRPHCRGGGRRGTCGSCHGSRGRHGGGYGIRHCGVGVSLGCGRRLLRYRNGTTEQR